MGSTFTSLMGRSLVKSLEKVCLPVVSEALTALRPVTPVRSTWQVISLPWGTLAVPLETVRFSAGPVAETTLPPKAVRSQVKVPTWACPLVRPAEMVKPDRGVVESFLAVMVKRDVSLAAPSTATSWVDTVA